MKAMRADVKEHGANEKSLTHEYTCVVACCSALQCIVVRCSALQGVPVILKVYS